MIALLICQGVSGEPSGDNKGVPRERSQQVATRNIAQNGIM
jgi:hypothetical protein